MLSLSEQIKNYLPAAADQKRPLFLLLTILAGIIILYPHLNYQQYLAQGDHGRDLYSYKITSEGAVPHKDFSSIHGPLMPYYYSLFNHIFGVSINSTLLGYNLCILIAGIMVFLICSIYLSPLFSFGASLWYWAFRETEFFYTYNHTGGIVMMLAAVYFLVRYIKGSDAKFIFFGSLSVILLFLIRPTIGVSALTAFILFLIIRTLTSESKGKSVQIIKYLLLTAAILLSLAAVYWFLTKDLAHHKGLSGTIYLKYLTPKRLSMALSAFNQITHKYFYSGLTNIIVAFISLSALALTFFKLNDRVSDQEHKKQLRIIFGFLFTLSVFNYGELLATGIWFYAMWNICLACIILFYAFNIGSCHFSRTVKTIVVAALFCLPLIQIINVNHFVSSAKQPANLFWVGKNKVYLHPGLQRHIHTLSQATAFLYMNVAADEKFLAVPYDPIYYFLSNRDSATRQLAILKFSETKEKELLKEIEDNDVRHVLVSNRAYRDLDKRFGVLGKDYGLKLQKLLDDHFTEVAVFGPWDATSGWISDHAVKIYRRK